MPYDPKGQSARYQRSEEALRKAGGRRLNVRLRPEAASKLDALVERTGQDQTTIVNNLIAMAKA